MADRSRAVYRGFGLLFPRDLDADPRDRWPASGALAGEVSYTQAGPYPGAPRPATSNRGRMQLQASGTLEGPLSASVEVRAQHAGLPGPRGTAGMVWRYLGETLWRGWEPPNTISAWEALEWTDGTADVEETSEAHTLGLHTGKVAVAYRDLYDDGGTPTYRVRVAVRQLDGSWVQTTVYSTTTAPTSNFYPCLWYVPGVDANTGGLFLAHWIEDTSVSPAVANVRVYQSDEDGETWTQAAGRALDTDVSLDAGVDGFDLGRLRVTWANWQAKLVAALHTHDTSATSEDIFLDFGAADEGTDFRLVSTWDKTLTGDDQQGGKYQDLIAVDGKFVLIYLTHNSSVAGAGRPAFRVVASAFEPLLLDSENAVDGDAVTATWGAISSGAFTDGDLAAVKDWDGTVYVYGREVGGDNDGVCFRSRDGCRTWEYMGRSSGSSSEVGHWWFGRDAATCPVGFSAAAQGGRIVLAHNWQANPGDEGGSLGVMYLGGWSTHVLPDLEGFPKDTRRVGWERTWLPFDLPDVVGWTLTSAGAVAADLVDGAFSLSVTAGQAYYSVVPTATPAQGLIVLIDVQVVSGGTMASDAVAVRLSAQSGGVGYYVSLRFSTTQFEVYDNVAGAVVSSATSADLTVWRTFLLSFASGKVSLVQMATSTTDARTFTAALTGATISSGAVAANSLRWGLGLAGATTAEANFRIVAYSQSTYVGRNASQLADGQTNPDDLFCAPLTARPYPLDAGLRAFTKTGPCFVGDSWTIPTAYEWPISYLMPEVKPSPRVGWRSTGDGAAHTIALTLSSLADSRTPRDTIVCALFGVEQRVHYLEGRSAGSGLWTTLATLNAAEGMDAVKFLRFGDALEPDTATSGSQTPYLADRHLVGGWVRLGTNRIRRVKDQVSGVWTTASYDGTAPRVVVTLADVDSGDATSGSAQLWAPNVCAIVHLAGAKYSHYRIRIPVQETPNDRFSIGTLFLGYVQVLGVQYGRGRGVDNEEGTQSEALEDGQVVVYEADPGRRLFDLSWPAAQTYGAQASPPAVDHVLGTSTSGGRPLAAPQSVAGDLQGIYARTGGRRDVCLYLPYVPQGPPDAVVLTSPEDFALVRIWAPPQFQATNGNERDDEVWSMTLGLREET